MPVYEYRCSKCNQEFEYQQRMSDDPKTVCEACGGSLERLISRTAFQLKGGGWYKDLYASAKPGTGSSSAGSSSSSTGSSSSGSSSGGDAKPSSSSDSGSSPSSGSSSSSTGSSSGAGSSSGSSSGSGGSASKAAAR